MDADGLTFACATVPEERAARRAGLKTALIGLAAFRGLPPGSLVSFGLAGGLTDELACGDVIDATRVVDHGGAVLWEGGPLGVRSARPGTILAAEWLIDDPEERRRLHARTGAEAADLESGPLARTERLVGCVRVVSDTPERTLQGVGGAVTADGKVRCRGVGRAFVTNPRGFLRASADAQRAVRKLRRVAEALR